MSIRVPHPTASNDDTGLDAKIGILLRVGVYSSAAVILLGGILYLTRHGGDSPDYGTFRGVQQAEWNLPGILSGVVHLQSMAILQLGLLMLIATPVARVVFSVFAFLVERDYLYVAISAIVLAVLMYSLFVH
jgi:uncharacterized membrane protein